LHRLIAPALPGAFRHEMSADITQRMESTFDRTGAEKEITADALRYFIEMWMGQQEWDHLEDDDFDCEEAEKKSFDALKAAWLSADIFSRAAPS
jgi:hypothetical protein